MTHKQRAGRIGLIVAAVVVGFIVVCRAVGNGEPSLKDVYVFEDGGQGYVSVLESRSYRGGRGSAPTSRYELAVFDLRSGEELARRELTDTERSPVYKIFRRVGPRVWARGSRDGVELLDLRTAAPLLTESELTARLPELAAGFKLWDMGTINDYSPPTAGLPLTLRDGRRVYLDMTPALRTSPVPTEPWKPGYFCGPDGGAKPSCERRECIAFQSVPGTEAMALGSAPLWRQKGLEVNPTNPAVPAEGAETRTFLRPGLVRLSETECAFELDGTVLVVHDSAAIDPKEPMLSRADRSGVRRWTVPVASLRGDHERLEPFEAIMVGGDLVVLLSEPRTKHSLTVALLDPATGTVRAVHDLVVTD